MSALIDSVNTYLQKIKDKFDELVENRDAIGPVGRYGTVRRGVVRGFIATLQDVGGYANNSGDFSDLDKQVDDANITLHFRLPWRTNLHTGMYHLRVTGYSLSSNKAIDVTAVGYVYQPYNDLISTDMKSNVTAEAYIDANRNAVLAITLPSIYYTSINIDSMLVGPNPEIRRGDILCKASKSNRVVFDPA